MRQVRCHAGEAAYIALLGRNSTCQWSDILGAVTIANTLSSAL